MVEQTSLIAWESIQEDIHTRQAEVYKAIKTLNMAYEQGCSNMEIARYLGWDINRVTPRVKELRSKHLVKENGNKICSITYREVKSWVV